MFILYNNAVFRFTVLTKVLFNQHTIFINNNICAIISDEQNV